MAERERLLVAIGDRRYPIDLGAYRRGTIDMSRTAVDQQAEPNDGTLSQTAAWKRTIENFTGGAGQVWADLPDTSERNRHRRSYGIEPFRYRSLQLAHAFQETDSGNDVTTPMKDLQVTNSNVIYGPVGADPCVLFSTSGDVLPWVATATTGTAIAGTVYDFTSDGDNVYIGTSLNIYEVVANTGVCSLFSATNAYALCYAGGRLIAGTGGGLLVELDNTGAATTILTHWSPTAYWLERGIVSTGQHIYAVIAPPTDQSEVYVMTVEDSTTALVPRMAVKMPEGERILSIAPGSGFVVLGTTAGARLATIEADGALTLGPLFISVESNPISQPWVRKSVAGRAVAVSGTRAYVMCAGDPMGELEAEAENTNVVCVVDLTRFIAELTPAWSVLDKTYDPATVPGRYALIVRGNVMTGGSSAEGQLEDCIITVNDEIRGIVDATRSPVGEWWSGRYTYGTPEEKRYQSVDLLVEQLPVGSSIDVSVITAAGEVSLGTVGGTGKQTFLLSPSILADWLEIHLTVTRGTDVTASPEVSRVVLRGVPVPDRVDEIYVPIIVTREVALPETVRGSLTFDPWDEYDYLHGLMEAGDVVRYEMGNEELAVVVQGLYYDGSDPNSRINGWTRTKDWIEGILVVKLETVPSVPLPEDTSVAALLSTEDPVAFLIETGEPLSEE